MKFSLLVTLSAVAAAPAFAASVTRENVKTVDAATYKLIANGTLSLADIPSVGRRDLQKRDAGNVFLCNDANWQGYCVYITDAGPDECVDLASDLDNLVSSVGPDPNQICTFYIAHNCDFLDDQFSVRSPGYSDLSKGISVGEGGAHFFNDQISSYKCHYDFF